MIEGSVDLATFRFACGWAGELDNPAEKVTVRAFCKGREIASAIACQPRPDLVHLAPEGALAFSLQYPEQTDPLELKFYAENDLYGYELPVIKKQVIKKGYQSFEDQKGDSDSFEKLKCLGLPERLDGKSVLDLGCNEGFFCINALNRGASEVTGIDLSAEYIKRARERNSRVNYIEGSWWDIPNKKYDLILLLSAFHYEERPKRFLDMLAGHLTPDGMLVLECGVAVYFQNQTWVSVQRGDGVYRYPSRTLLTNTLLSRYYTRFYGRSINQSGDPVARFVFHASLKKPLVIFLSGPTLQGKTILSSVLGKSENVLEFSIDLWLWQMKTSNLPLPADNSIFAKIKSGFYPSKVGAFIDALTAAQNTDFADAIFASLPLAAECVIVEGYALEREDFAGRLEQLLKDRGARVWRLSRI